MKMLIAANGRKFMYRQGDLHTQYGYIKGAEIEKAKPGTRLKTNTGVEMTIVDARFMDLYFKIKRSAQIIPLKDVAKIVAETGIGKNSRILDAGSGSGALCCFLANFAKKVYTYEIREDFAKIVERNIKYLDLKNVTLKMADAYENIRERNLDLVVLDLPEPWKAISNAKKALKPGGFLVNYSPTIPQVSDFVEAARKEGFAYLKTTETIEREWDVDGRKVRPKSQPIGHSGFLSFCRKV